jgi:hypothetical protein
MSAAKMPMMAITTSNSSSVKAVVWAARGLLVLLFFVTATTVY